MSANVRIGTTALTNHQTLAEGGRTLWLRKIGVSVVDQALLSVLSLAIGLLFVRLSSKSEYALYAQMSALVLLVSSAATATINSPLMTLLPQTPEPGRTQLATAALKLLLLMCAPVAAVVGASVWLVPSLLAVANPSFSLLAALFAAILTAALREFFRNLFFINLRPVECLRLDVVYVLACAAAIVVLVEFAQASAVTVLAISAAAGG
jgi:O-antigen/teichoic acid export membrane protein